MELDLVEVKTNADTLIMHQRILYPLLISMQLLVVMIVTKLPVVYVLGIKWIWI